jgi:predicted regulator of Ras-like GTPase activity (Roadblock/LC7/MglB family)
MSQMSPMSPSSLHDDARSFSWLLSSFVEQTAGVTDAVAVSSDGLLMAMSSQLDRPAAEQVAAIISGLVSLGHGASGCFGFDGLEQMIIAMRRGLLLVASISDGSCVGVVARKGCDIGLVGYQMTLLVERAGAVLTPALVTELKQEMLVR